MFDILFNEDLGKNFLIPFGISEEEVRDTVERSDQQSVVRAESGETFLTLYSKNYPSKKPPYHLVAHVEHKDGDRIVQAALKYFDNSGGRPVDISPVNMIRSIVERFGFDVTVKGSRSRFHYNEVFPLTSYDLGNLADVHPESDRDYLMQGTFVLRENDVPPVYYLCIVYCINTKKYLNWINIQ